MTHARGKGTRSVFATTGVLGGGVETLVAEGEGAAAEHGVDQFAASASGALLG